MALVTYLIGYCGGGPAILVDFDSSSLPAVNGNYFLTFTGGTTPGCYDIIDNAEPNTGTDKVLTMSVDYTDCATCLAVVTPTPTVTTTVTPTSPLQPFGSLSGSTRQSACNSSTMITLYGFSPLFDENNQFYNEPSGTVTIDLSGFYVNSDSVIELNSTGGTVGTFTLCSVVPTSTPTPTSTTTPTVTPTPNQTSTPTPTVTQTPTQTFAWYTYSLGTGTTAINACTAFGSSPITIYGSVAGGVGPNVGEYLYETAGIPLSDAVPDGYYSNGTAWYQVTGGAGQITSADPNGC